jgi:branched-chain amino acid transport system ATP-binding protein
MLEVSDLKVKYGEVAAVKGVSLSVPEGSIVVLLGANGAGKSSTLNAIVGLVACTGAIRFEGTSLSGQPAEDIVKRGIALTPEGRRVFPSLSVADNLHLGGAAHASGEELKKRVEAELDRFPILRERYHQKSGLLSGGEQQMLAIARSLMAGPRLLLLDEPSLGLAPLIVDKVFDLILDLKRRGLTILLVEQNAERALEIADHGYVLQTGQVVLEGTGAELARSDLVKQAYLAG